MSSKTYQFRMEMTCEGCTGAAKRILGKLGDAVSNIETSLADKTVTVSSTLSSDQLKAELEKSGKAITFIGEK